MLRFVSVRTAMLAVLVLAAGCQPHGPDALRRGDELLRAGKVAEAVPLLERAATDLPDDPRAWNFLGLAYHDAARPGEALKAYLRALHLDRNYFDVHYNLGALHSEQGNWTEAERSLRTFLAPDANRNHGVAWGLLGDAQLRLRKLEEAEHSLSFAAKLDPNNADVWNNLGLVYAGKRRWANARQDFAYAIRLDPRNASARLNLAVATQQAGDRRGALPLYRDYLAAAPNAANAEEIRGLIRQLEAQFNGGAPTVALTNAVATAKAFTNPPVAVVKPPASTNTAPPKATPPATKAAVETRPTAASKRTGTGTATETASANSAPPKAAAQSKPETPKTTVAEPAPMPTPTTEVVRVDDSPTLRPARDVTPANVPADTTAAATTPAPATVASATTTEPPVTSDRTRTARPEPPKRRTIWQRANPVGWFRDDPTPPPRSAVPPATLPLPDNAPAAAAGTPVAAARPTLPAPVPKPRPPKPEVARYASRSPADLSPGNRADAEVQFAAAVTAHDRRDLANAIALYQRTVELDPSYFSAHYNLGLAALDSGNVSRALLAGECATRLNPGSTAARRLFASALQRGNYPADAAEQLEKVAAAEPNDASTQLALAGLYARSLGEPDKARPHYERVLALDPQNAQSGAIRVWLAENP